MTILRSQNESPRRRRCDEAFRERGRCLCAPTLCPAAVTHAGRRTEPPPTLDGPECRKGRNGEWGLRFPGRPFSHSTTLPFSFSHLHSARLRKGIRSEEHTSELQSHSFISYAV